MTAIFRSENGQSYPRGDAMIHGMDLDGDACYRAIQTRDARFDGRLFAAVHTTGVYCRPVCPSRRPKRENVSFYASAAAAQEAGFRPCLRCRPETSPELAVWAGTSNTVSRALTLIAEGALDGTEADVEKLASRVGVGDRHLRRLFQQHLGASPIAVAQARRVHFARQLLDETRLGMADITLAAGFGSLRRFNDVFRRLYDEPPSALRRRSRKPGPRKPSSVVQLKLSYAPPYDWDAMIAFLAARAIPGVEVVTADCYRRTIEFGGECGVLEVAPISGKPALAATIRFPNVKALPAIVNRVRRVFDLGADVDRITEQLARDETLAPLVAARPGLRVPGAWDGFELAVRAVLGQQITVAAARRLAGKLADRYGRTIPPGDRAAPGLTVLFPRPERLVRADLAKMGMPRSRAATLSRIAAADPALFRSGQGLEAAVADLKAIRGIGEWTAQYIALRGLRDPDAFPAADIGLIRAMKALSGTRPSPPRLLARAEAWRPWRAYAAQHLWTFDPKAPSDRS